MGWFSKEKEETDVAKDAIRTDEPTLKTRTGKVIQKAESLYSSTFRIHLAVDCAAEGDLRREIIAFRGISSFAMLPLAEVGDVVTFTYTDANDYIDLKRFGIEWQHRDGAPPYGPEQ